MDSKALAMAQMSGVVAVIVTYRRSFELGRLLEGLSRSETHLLGCIVVDHAADPASMEIPSKFGPNFIVLPDVTNPGPGAGWARGAKFAFEHFGSAHVTAIWYLDDDVVIGPEVLGTLLTEIGRAKADSIAPLLEDSNGFLWAFPEPLEPSLRKTIRLASTPADARTLLGDAPQAFCWCTGACFLVTKQAINRVGLHRPDFWILGEDIEYSMRLSSKGGGVFTCMVSVPHLPPPPRDAKAARKGDYVKFCSLLQNLTFLAFHSPDSRHMKRYLPGNFRRFFSSHGLGLRTLRDGFACAWNGLVRAEPAGRSGGTKLRERISHYGW